MSGSWPCEAEIAWTASGGEADGLVGVCEAEVACTLGGGVVGGEVDGWVSGGG
ncbi:MAG: hypothetical protein ACYCU5_08375 [Actinomycetes bacterium]